MMLLRTTYIWKIFYFVYWVKIASGLNVCR